MKTYICKHCGKEYQLDFDHKNEEYCGECNYRLNTFKVSLNTHKTKGLK